MKLDFWKLSVWSLALAAACVLTAVPALAADRSEDDEAAADTAGLVAIPLELPDPSFGGTPLDYYHKNLEPRSLKPREPFLAPDGVTNVAKDAAVTSSDESPNFGKLAFITDGEKSYNERYIVELDKGPQWVQIDLGKKVEIHAIVLWHYFEAERVYFDTIVKVADNAEFTENVQTLVNNDFDNSSGYGVGEDKMYIETNEGRLIDAKGVVAQYVRLSSNGNTSDEYNHYIEVEVYGKPVQ